MRAPLQTRGRASRLSTTGVSVAVLFLVTLAGAASARAATARATPASVAILPPAIAGAEDYALTIEYAVTNSPASGGQIDFTATVVPHVSIPRATIQFTASGNVTLAPPIDPVVLTDLEQDVPVDLTGTLDITTNGSGRLSALVEVFRATTCGEKTRGPATFDLYVLDDGVAVYTDSTDPINVEAARIMDLYNRSLITEAEAQQMADALVTEEVQGGGRRSGGGEPPQGGRAVTTVTFSGTAQWLDIQGATHPARFVKVEALCYVLGSSVSLGSVNAAADGTFSLTVNHDFGSLPRDVQLLVWADNYAARATQPVLAIGSGSTYGLFVWYRNIPDGTTTYSGLQIRAGNCGAVQQAFSLVDAVIEGYDYYQTVEGTAPNKIAVNWPLDGGSFYDIFGNDSIQIGKNNAFAWDIILHEYGHYIAWNQQFNCFDCFPFCSHVATEDQTLGYGRIKGTKLAWQEGLANYFSAAAQVISGTGQLTPPIFLSEAGNVAYNDVISLENCTGGPGVNVQDTRYASNNDAENAGTPVVPAGDGNELTVARILWDLADDVGAAGTPEAKDQIALGHAGLWNLLKQEPVHGLACDNLGSARYTRLADLWERLTDGKTEAEKLVVGAIFELNRAAPMHIKPAEDAKLPDAATPPRFSWSGTESYDEFTVKIYDSAFNLVLTSPAVHAPQLPNFNFRYVDSNGWTPTPAEWDTIRDAATNGVGTNGIYWAVEGSHSAHPGTGTYLSGAWHMGASAPGKVDIAFIIDISGSMSAELPNIQIALNQAIDNVNQGYCSDPSYSAQSCSYGPQQCPTCPALPISSTVFQLTTFKDGGTLAVPGVANIFGAGHAVAPAPGGGGGGILPTLVPLPSGTGRIVTYSSVTGWTSCGCSSPNPPYPPGNSSGPDGGSCASGTTDILSWGGISGIINAQKSMFLCGVFLGPNEPADPAPPRLDFTNNMNFLSLAPLIGQTFFIGDGLTGTGSGTVQQFLVPDTATRLYLGFADALEFGNPTSYPGFYWDNCGQLSVQGPLVGSNPPTCCKDSIRSQVNALTADGEVACGEPSVQALLVGTANLKPGGTVFFATDEPPSGGTNLYQAIATLRARGVRVNVLLTGDCTTAREAGARAGGYASGLEAFSQMAAETDGSFTYLTDLGTSYQNAIVNIAQAGVSPTIVSSAPAKMQQASTARLTLVGQGTNFNAETTVAFGTPDLWVTDVQAVSPIELDVLVVAAADAALGFADVMVTTPLSAQVTETATGTGVVQVVPTERAPRLVSITPPVIAAGQSGDLEIRGAHTHFTNASVPNLGAGVTVNTVTAPCATSLLVNVTVDAAAALNFRNVSVTTGSEVASGAWTEFFRVQGVPEQGSSTLQVNPSVGRAGQSFVMRITLQSLAATEEQAGAIHVTFQPADFLATGVEVCAADTLDVQLVGVSDAALGFHDVTVTTPDGTAVGLGAFLVLSADADCNGNGTPDAQDLAGGTSLDCNGNALPDECEPDCNGNGTPDDCDIAQSLSADCNCNLRPDECETSSAFDCNSNGTPDDCELLAGGALDCNTNGLPDACDIARGFSRDCDADGIPDDCDLAAGLGGDCNSNGWLDSCDLTAGTSVDCQGNGIPDECDLRGTPMAPSDMAELNAAAWDRWAEDGQLTLFDDSGLKHTGRASIRIEATGGFDNYVRHPAGAPAGWDLSTVQSMRMWFFASNPNGFQNGSPWIRLGSADGYYEWRTDHDILNEAIGQWVEFVIPTAGGATWGRSAVGTPALSNVDYLEIHADTWGAGFTLWMDGVRFEPTPLVVAPDCNSNAVPDVCDMAAGTSADCNTNGVPDECESTIDCNFNGIPDVCDVHAGTSLDCNTNGIPDECERSATLGALYVVELDGPGLYRMNPADGALTWVADMHQMDYTVYGAYGLSQHPLTGEMYVVVDVESSASGYGFALAAVDVHTAELNIRGFLGETTLADIAFRADGTLYGIELYSASGDLLTVDPADASVSPAGINLGAGYGQSLAFQPGSGLLYHMVTTYGALVTRLQRVDLDTSDVEEVATYDYGIYPEALVFHPSGAPFLGFGAYSEDYSVFAIDANSGGLTGVAQPYLTLTGAAFRVGDCNENGTLDACEPDCNHNHIPDDCDLALGGIDCNHNGIPDECELPGGTTQDCNANGSPDHCEILLGAAADCNGNWVPDECDVSGGTSSDCNSNGVPDECDIAGTGAAYPPPDMAERNALAWAAWAQDGQATLVDDLDFKQVGQASVRMEVTGGLDNSARYPANQSARWNVSSVQSLRIWFYAINPNGGFQEASPRIRLGNADGYYEWRPTWDILNQALGQWVEFVIPLAGDATWLRSESGSPALSEVHYLEVFADTWGAGFTLWIDGVAFDPPITAGNLDCNENGVLDACDVAAGTSTDCSGNGTPDECEPDCNSNGVADACDLANGPSTDCDGNGVPDECEIDCNANGVLDRCDLAAGTSRDCNSNGIPDECDIAQTPAADCNLNGALDACEGTTLSYDFDFETGLPPAWSADGLWHVTDQCARAGPCDPGHWAYYGLDANCNFDLGDQQTVGALSAAPLRIPQALRVTLTYCSVYEGEAGDSNVSGYDWAWLSVGGVEVDDVSLANRTGWETRRVDLSAYAGQTVTLQWQFDSRDGFGNGGLGWQIDRIRLTAQGPDCNFNGVLDACDIAAGTSQDANRDGIPDECALAGDCNGDGHVDLADFVTFASCMTDPQGGPVGTGCACADLDADGDADLNDFAVFQENFAG